METLASNLSSACELRDALSNGSVSLEDVLADSKHKIAHCEPQIQAWEFLDWSGVQTRIDALLDIPKIERGPLWGVPVALKDIFDTYDMPTAYGSTIYSGHQPVADAACVARLRAAGALLLGKTVSTEFAFWKQGKTRNPLNPAHSPGGSSSGSAAAVADFVVPLALGSQTAASTIRPASYCGIVGFKPTYGAISTAGVKALAASMDTIGLFARNIDDISLLFDVLIGTTGSESTMTELPDRLRFRIWDEGELENASSDCLSYFNEFQLKVESLGIVVREAPGKPQRQPLYSIQTELMAYESNRELAFEYHFHKENLSDVLINFLQEGSSLNESSWNLAQKYRSESLATLDDYFGDAQVLIMPSTTDVAPLYDEGTGDPIMSRAWTLLGLPSITLPLLNQTRSLPLGIQLAARPGQDRFLLSVAQYLLENVSTVQSSLHRS